MSRAWTLPPFRNPNALELRGLAAAAALLFFMLVPGSASPDAGPALQLLGGGLSGGLILAYVLQMPRRADSLDSWLLVALLFFLCACLTSTFPRQSLGSAFVVLTYVSGVFVLRDILSSPSAHKAFAYGLMTLSGFLTVVIAFQMIVPFIRWWSLTNWTVFPPLDMYALAQPWNARYETTLLVVLLYPTWWLANPGKLRSALRALVGAAVLACCVIAGSRTVWAAALVGVVVAAGPTVASVVRRRRMVPAFLAMIAVLASMLLLSGAWLSLADRLAGAAPVAERLSVWGPAIQQWLERPLTGLGPGSFPWILHLTSYFNTHTFSPSHPDSAIIDAASEAGILGLTASAIVVASVGRTVFSRGPRVAQFVIAVWLIACVTLTPTVSEYLVVAMIGWIGIAAPHQSRPVATSSDLASPELPRLRPLLVSALSIVLVAGGAITAGTILYWAAQQDIASGNLGGAARSLTAATMLDPSLALYPRQAGTLKLIEGQAGAATIPLRRAVILNSYDDVAWRTLGLAYNASGRPADGMRALERAVEIDRSDPTNLLLLAAAEQTTGNEARAEALLAEVVQAWPTIVAAPGWDAFAAPAPNSALLARAYSRWVAETPSPRPLSYQELLLGVMVGAGIEIPQEAGGIPSPLADSYVAVMRCDSTAAGALAGVPNDERRNTMYWELQIREAELQGKSARDLQEIHWLMTRNDVLVAPWITSERLNPFHDSRSRLFSADAAGYGREPIDWPSTKWDLPSPRAGFARWHNSPRAAASDAGLTAVLPACE